MSEEHLDVEICCRLNDLKCFIINFLTSCHVKPQSAKVCRDTFSVSV